MTTVRLSLAHPEAFYFSFISTRFKLVLNAVSGIGFSVVYV